MSAIKRKACEVILYPEDGWTVDKIISVIKKKDSIKIYAIMLHDKDIDQDGSPKKPHFHVYLSFGNTSIEFNYVATWFNTSEGNIEKIQSKGRNSRYDYLLYLTHKKQPEKYQYDIEGISANFDVAAYLGVHEQKIALESIIEKCGDGTITRLNYTDYIDVQLYAKHKQRIDRAWEYYESSIMSKSFGNRRITVIWICGESKLGKTTMAKLFAMENKEPIYITAEGAHPFDGYTAQRIICIDEIRPNDPFTFKQLLEIIDNNTVRELGARYHNKFPYFYIVFITSIYSPWDFYLGCGQPEEQALQFYRRITELWIVTKEFVSIQTYDYNRSRFLEKSRAINPVPLYLDSLEPPKPLNSANALGRIGKKYMNEQLSFDAVFTEVPEEDDKDNPFTQGDPKNGNS